MTPSVITGAARKGRRRRVTLVAGLLAGTVAASPVAFAEPGAGDTRPWVVGTHTVPYFDPAAAISERIEVDTGTDGDQDGDVDRIYVDLLRPDTAEKVPLIVRASPYYGLGPRGWEQSYFVPRGYAVAKVSLPGTDRSTGCDDVGGDLEVIGTKAIVDWANGRAKGYDADSGQAVAAGWSTGDVGMIGKSWDGTIANAVAATGVEGLKTIVPVAAISSWYDYTRQNGIPQFPGHVAYLHEYVSNFDSAYCRTLTGILQQDADDATGNYNSWWKERDYRVDASKITASVFVVHGLSDENVKTRQFGEWWDQLAKYGVDRKIFLHQLDHVDPYDEFGAHYTDPLNEWFDYYLMGLQNGVPDGPQAIIEREDGSWSTDEVWPPADTAMTKMKLAKPLGRSAGLLSTAPAGVEAKTVTIRQTTDYTSDSIVSNPTQPRTDRAVFLSDQLGSALRESGTATVRVRVKVDKANAGLQARVVDYDGGSAYVVSRTMADLGHYQSWKNKTTLTPGKYYTLTWEINTDDRVFAADHVLGLVLTAEQHNPTAPYQPVTATIKTSKSFVAFPLSGAVAGLASTGAVGPIITTSVTPSAQARDLGDFVREFLE
jgi:X-Pro dipeptidyl-peptidase